MHQLVVVTTGSWTAVDGSLQRYERAAPGERWLPVGSPWPVVVGKNGLGWGRGIVGCPADGPQKREGDGRAPAGAFLLTGAFGYAPREQLPWVLLPYEQMTAERACVDDVRSLHYNAIVSRSAALPPDWTSAEDMRRDDDLYELGIVVGHNLEREPGAGSCIFVHLWRGPGLGTAGCTAMAATDLRALLRWLDPAREPCLVQVPSPQLGQLCRDLPELASVAGAGTG